MKLIYHIIFLIFNRRYFDSDLKYHMHTHTHTHIFLMAPDMEDVAEYINMQLIFNTESIITVAVGSIYVVSFVDYVFVNCFFI